MPKTIPVAKITVETTNGAVLVYAVAPNDEINMRAAEKYAKAAAKKVKGAYVYFDVERLKMPYVNAYQACKDYSRGVFRGV